MSWACFEDENWYNLDMFDYLSVDNDDGEYDVWIVKGRLKGGESKDSWDLSAEYDEYHKALECLNDAMKSMI